ncbi:Haloalkane dehalogenase [Oscillatoria nigro-viridis PCC 7112]|uniref:Haloalkane dehalogenase n=1 Tax=Phormidium nigroviride PCC 7112 TaxID=179408 RepID=K9VE80_9CYAN|nr:alpha/beta fold hydrolase [Oscillatoria nigro-viridis]AFZ06463.1 Haloalkane dehalogenase [Oscillatoria nigro-viridis PCC 7112]
MLIDEKIVEVGPLQWFYRETNPVNETEKPPVLLLHGLPSQSFTWTVMMPDLAAQGFRSIAPDWVGYGRSTKPDKRDFAYTPDAFVDALAGFIQAIELDRFYLVVQGFLASAGIQYALRNPDKIERLAVINTPVSPDIKLPWKMQQLGLPFIGDMMTQDPLLVDRTLEGGCRQTISDKDLDVYRRPFLKSSDAGRSLMNTVRNIQLPQSMAEIESGLKAWTRPTLFVWGLTDPWLSVEPVQKLVGSLQNAELVTLEQAGHYPQEHWSEKVGNAVITFLRRQEVK